MGYISHTGGNYYEGDMASSGDTIVPRRPSSAHKWDGTAWQLDTRLQAALNIASLEAQQVMQLTPRAMREFMLGVALMIPAGTPMPPALQQLKALDDAIVVLRQKP